MDDLTDKDVMNYLYTLADKIIENENVMSQIDDNTREQAMLGDFPTAADDAIIESNDAHQNQMMQLLSDSFEGTAMLGVLYDAIKFRQSSE